MRPLAVLGPAEEDLGPLFDDFGITTVSMLSLATVASLAGFAAGFVGNDSGVSHLAAAAGASGVVIFGPTDPARWRPLGRVTVLCTPELEALQVAPVLDALTQACAGHAGMVTLTVKMAWRSFEMRLCADNSSHVLPSLPRVESSAHLDQVRLESV